MRARYTIRKIRLSDVDGIMVIERSSFGRDAYDRNLFAEYFHKCGDLFLAAADGRGNLCGYMITCIRGERAEVVSIAVDPARRGRGIASALMDSTLRRLRRRGAGRLVLMVRETNGPARAFYEKYGFEKVRRVPRYYEDGGDGWLMGKNL